MKNLRRAVKYFLFLCVLCVVLVLGLHLIGAGGTSLDGVCRTLFGTQRGAVLIAAVVLLSAAYPFIGFMRRTVAGDMEQHREAIVETFAQSGFRLKESREGFMRFGAATLAARLRLLGEDEITVTGNGPEFIIEGIRRAAVPVAVKIERIIENNRI
ncbi:MAG: hypothetical protein J1D86_00970 [Alistipes sp.]|nr:hypothetical protein [Alistipes sp.]